MEIRDILLTPLYLIFIYLAAFHLKSRITNKHARKYFIPALTLKLIGAVTLGLIYTFYYSGGDTFNYYKQGKVIYSAFWDSPISGFKLLLNSGEFDPSLLQYIGQMYWFQSASEYAVIKFVAFFGLFSFNTYSVIALFFACFSFWGLWAMYTTLLKMFPGLHKQFALALFFVPSLFFWGSGILKDTICIGMLGLLFQSFYNLAIQKKNILLNILFALISILVLKTIKAYILLAFVPPALFWIFLENRQKIKNGMLRLVLGPFLILIGGFIAYYGATNITAGDEKYDLDKIAGRTKVNAEYLYQISQKQEGSAYSIGELDGTIPGMIKLAPQAIIVALYRPFIWEVKNPLMLLSAVEALFFLILTITTFSKVGWIKSLKLVITKPILTFCFVFSIIFAFAVGINSFNFGTLVRYKIPLIPFYLSGLFILRTYAIGKANRLPHTKLIEQRETLIVN